MNQLRPADRVAIVVYAGAAGVVLPSTPGDRKDVILDAIENLQAGGSTAGAQGILLASETARRNLPPQGNNRVILATDGDFNVGVSSEGELTRLIEEQGEHGVFLTVLGFGTGNLKDAKMEQLADKGAEWMTVKLRYKPPTGSTSRLITRTLERESGTPSETFRFASAVAGVGMMLRGSEQAGAATYASLAALATGAKGTDRDGYRAEFVRLVEAIDLLSRQGMVGARDRQ